MTPFAKNLLTCLLAGGLFCLSNIAKATTLDEAIENIAGNVADYLEEKGQNQIMLGNFDGPGGATAGRAIRAKLESLLTAKEVTVVELGSNWKLRGEFSFEPQDTFSIVLIKTALVDKSGKEISGFREKVKVEKVTSLEDITRTLGLTVDLRSEQGDGSAAGGTAQASSDTLKTEAVSGTSDASTSSTTTVSGGGAATSPSTPDSGLGAAAETLVANRKKVTEKVTSSVSNPTFAFASGTKSEIAADSSSPFRMEILVRRPGSPASEPLPIQDAGGFPFAPLSGGDVYQVRVHNDADHPVGVKLAIDGINTFALSTDPQFRELGTWFVGPKSAGVIGGWYVDAGLLKSFLVTAKGDELNLPDAADLGTITAQFFHAWREGDPVPAIESAAQQRGQLRTTAGPDILRQTRATRSFFGKQLLAAVSIRYSNPDDLPPGE